MRMGMGSIALVLLPEGNGATSVQLAHVSYHLAGSIAQFAGQLQLYESLVQLMLQCRDDLILLLDDALQPIHVHLEVLQRLQAHDCRIVEHLQVASLRHRVAVGGPVGFR